MGFTQAGSCVHTDTPACARGWCGPNPNHVLAHFASCESCALCTGARGVNLAVRLCWNPAQVNVTRGATHLASRTRPVQTLLQPQQPHRNLRAGKDRSGVASSETRIHTGCVTHPGVRRLKLGCVRNERVLTCVTSRHVTSRQRTPRSRRVDSVHTRDISVMNTLRVSVNF